MKKRFSEEQIIGFLREAEAGMAVKDLCRKHGYSEASYYLWRSKFGGKSVPETKHPKSQRLRTTDVRWPGFALANRLYPRIRRWRSK